MQLLPPCASGPPQSLYSTSSPMSRYRADGGPSALPETPHQHGDIRPLPTAIGVKLVQYEEVQSLAIANDARVHLRIEPRQDQLQHHEVGQQNVRWICRH